MEGGSEVSYESAADAMEIVNSVIFQMSAGFVEQFEKCVII